MGTLLLYLIGLFLIAGDLTNVLAEVSALDASLLLQSDQVIALLVITVVVLAVFPLLQQLIRLSSWLGVFILLASLIASLLLVAGIMTFEDRRLLVITSALLGSTVLSLVPLSALALFGNRVQKRGLGKQTSLQKLHILEPGKLFITSTKQSLSRYLSVAQAITFGGFLYLYSMYLDVSLSKVLDSVVYSLWFFVAVSLYVVGYVRSMKRLLQ